MCCHMLRYEGQSGNDGQWKDVQNSTKVSFCTTITSVSGCDCGQNDVIKCAPS